MRQEDRIDSFDLEVRDLLGSAEESVPPCVWDAVSSRLDDTSAVPGYRRAVSGFPASGRGRAAGCSGRKSPMAGRRIAVAASLAIAASLALLLILPGEYDTAVPAGDALALASPASAEPEPVGPAYSGPVPVESAPVIPAAVPKSGSGSHATSKSGSGAGTSASADSRPGSGPGYNPGHVADRMPDTSAPAGPGSDSGSDSPSSSSFVVVSPGTGGAGDSLTASADWGADEQTEDLSGRFSFVAEGALNVNESRLASGMDARAHMTSGSSSRTITSIEEESVSAYDIPLSFGLGIRYSFAPRFSVGTGVIYSLVGRTFTGTYYELENGALTRVLSGDIRHTVHYLGVPVNFYFDFVKAKSVDCYAYAGGTVDFCICNKYSIQDAVLLDPVRAPQFSIGAGLGVQFKVSKSLGIYIDPGVRYYFRCDQPKSIRTDQPFMVNFEAGLRFNL